MTWNAITADRDLPVVDASLLGEHGQQGAIGAGVVGIEHGGARNARLWRRGIEGAKQQGLCRYIGSTGAVVIQMLMGNVGDGRHVEVHRCNARLIQAMAGAFNDGVVAVFVNHRAQEALHIGGVGRRHVQPGVGLAPTNARPHRGDYADATGRLIGITRSRSKDRLQQRTGGRLAVRPGDADDGKAAAWEILERCAGLRQRLPAVGNLDVAEIAWQLSRARQCIVVAAFLMPPRPRVRRQRGGIDDRQFVHR